jgi:hypothetical protein
MPIQLSRANSGRPLTTADYNSDNLIVETAVNALQAATSSNGTVTSVSDVDTDVAELFSTSIDTPTSTPVITYSRISKAANLVYASPNGTSGKPTMRALVSGDLPVVPATKGGTGLITIQVNKVLRGKGDGSAVEYAGIVPSISARIAVTPTVSNYELDIVPANIEIDSLAATTKLSIAKGGTGQGTAQAAINALTSAASNADKFLKSDGTNASFQVLPNIVTAKITDNNVTYAKIQTVGASKILGNPTASVANTSEIGIDGNLYFNGATLVDRLSVVYIVNTNYSMNPNDGSICVSPTTGTDVTITLPVASNTEIGRIFIVKKITSSTEDTVRVIPENSGTDLIDGSTDVSIPDDYGCLSLQYIGVVGGRKTWCVISKVA